MSHKILGYSLRTAFCQRSNLFPRKSPIVRQLVSSNHLSLDANLVATNLDTVLEHLRARHASETLIEDVCKIPQLREKRNSLITEGDAARNTRKTLSKEIGKHMSKGEKEQANILKGQVEEANEIAAKADDELQAIEKEIHTIMSLVPNLLDDRVPKGKDDNDNQVVYTWGEELRKVTGPNDQHIPYLWHDEIAKLLGGLDSEAATSISGTRFSVLVGPLARLERALTSYFLDFHASRGYQEVSIPYIVSRSTLYGTGQLPKFEPDLFQVNHQVHGEDAFLIPTAEVPVTNLFQNQILSHHQLPIKLVCYSPSFRAEAGSAGKDTRGLLRQHQFHKVELVKITASETSTNEHEALTNDAEALLQSLNLPYRKVLLCSGDIGFAARICYDLEVWLPGQQQYREISSCSNCYDFQAKRMKLRYRVQEGEGQQKKEKIAYAHTMNGSGVAIGRALVAILENYQQPDGSVLIPKVLQPYMGGLEVLTPMSTNSASTIADIYHHRPASASAHEGENYS